MKERKPTKKRGREALSRIKRGPSAEKPINPL